MSLRLVVLVSGGGSNLQAIIDACGSGRLDAEVVGVLANREGIGAGPRAQEAGIDYRELTPYVAESRYSYDARLAEAIAPWRPDIVVLAGWMRVLTAEFCRTFELLNLHPALPGEFPGINAVARAHAGWRAGEITESGVMVHRVPDEGVDSGPVVVSEVVPFEPGDDLKTFERRMHTVEHRLIVEAIDQLAKELS